MSPTSKLRVIRPPADAQGPIWLRCGCQAAGEVVGPKGIDASNVVRVDLFMAICRQHAEQATPDPSGIGFRRITGRSSQFFFVSGEPLSRIDALIEAIDEGINFIEFKTAPRRRA